MHPTSFLVKTNLKKKRKLKITEKFTQFCKISNLQYYHNFVKIDRISKIFNSRFNLIRLIWFKSNLVMHWHVWFRGYESFSRRCNSQSFLSDKTDTFYYSYDQTIANVTRKLFYFRMAIINTLSDKYSSDKNFLRIEFSSPSRNFVNFVQFLPAFFTIILNKLFHGTQI